VDQSDLCAWGQVRLPAAQLAGAVKNHWMVEAWHWLRGVTLGKVIIWLAVATSPPTWPPCATP
jgi:hypothetical protein